MKEEYKRTKLGIIPKDWEVKTLGELGDIITGSTPSTTNKLFYDNGLNDFIGPGDLNSNKFIIKCEKKVTDKGLISGRVVPENSILVTCIGSTIGKIGINKNRCITNQQINAIIPIDNDFNFVYYSVLNKKNRLKLIAGEQAIPVLNKTEFSKFQIPIPCLKEQEAIADCLSTWDKAIELQQDLISSKESRKKALAQQLLTGKRRLPGFTDDWSFIKFKDIYRENKIKAGNEKFEVLSVTKNGIVSQSEYFNKEIASDDSSKYLVVRRDDFVVSGLNFWMGSYEVLRNFDIGMVSPAYKVYKLDSKYEKVFFKFFTASKLMRDAMVGASIIGASVVRRNFDKEILFEWSFKIPNNKEQLAIGNVLETADKELQLEKQKLSNLQQQKKALMQQLLTGKVRLV